MARKPRTYSKRHFIENSVTLVIRQGKSNVRTWFSLIPLIRLVVNDVGARVNPRTTISLKSARTHVFLVFPFRHKKRYVNHLFLCFACPTISLCLLWQWRQLRCENVPEFVLDISNQGIQSLARHRLAWIKSRLIATVVGISLHLALTGRP